MTGPSSSRGSSPDPGRTPLDADEAAQLRQSWVSTHADLDLAETRNILAARRWADARRLDVFRILDDAFLRELHRRMFGDVWNWAGRYRTSGKNIGVDWHQVSGAVRQLVGDASSWCQSLPTAVSPDEIAVRFHHQLVAIHPFVNGNGRHGRFATDLLVVALGRPAFSWGAHRGDEMAGIRQAYVDALRRIDDDPDDISALRDFARS